MVVLLGSTHKNYPTRFSRKRLFTSQYNSRRTTLPAVTQFFYHFDRLFCRTYFRSLKGFLYQYAFLSRVCVRFHQSLYVHSLSIAHNVLEQFVGTNLKLLQVTLNEFLSTRVLECLTIWMVFNIYTVK